MPDPSLVASITTSFGVYSQWKTVSVERTLGETFSYATFTSAENGADSIQLMPGDTITITLGGQLAMTGLVGARQASYEATNKEVQIIAATYTTSMAPATVQTAPGQYIGYNLQQIANAVTNPLGINTIVDTAENALKVFPRVSEFVGESVNDFLTRLGMMRDLFPVDDEQGNFHLTNGSALPDTLATLVEGQNILKARLTLNQLGVFSAMLMLGQDQGGSSTGAMGPTAAQPTSASISSGVNTVKPRPAKAVANEPADQADLVMRVNHELNLMLIDAVDGLITVPGWFAPDGSLWCAYANLRKQIEINSPSLIRASLNPFTLLLKGAKCIQDENGGTVTELHLTTLKNLRDANLLGPVSG